MKLNIPHAGGPRKRGATDFHKIALEGFSDTEDHELQHHFVPNLTCCDEAAIHAMFETQTQPPQVIQI